MLNLCLQKVERRRFRTFPLGISPKVNAIAQLKFELGYSDVTVQHISNFSQWFQEFIYNANNFKTDQYFLQANSWFHVSDDNYYL